MAGKDYFTLPEMMVIISKALKNHNIFWGTWTSSGTLPRFGQR